MNEPDNAIDMVYLWVDGADPEWRKKRDALIGTVSSSRSENCEGRYADNDELKFSLRSLDLYAPWIRRIFIVTDHQVPSWLDVSNPRIRIVDHSEILPPEMLPTFNSVSIEHALIRIPGLGERFLYANDDMLFNRPASPSDFFTPEGFPIIRMHRRPFRRLSLWFKKYVQRKKLSNYNLKIHNAAMLIKREYGVYPGAKTHHNIDAYLRSQNERTFEKFREDILPTMAHRMRNDTDIQRNIYSYVPMVEGKARVDFVDRKTSFHLHIDNPSHFEKLERHNPLLFCINDSEYATAADRLRARSYLEKRFPEKSQFEK